MNKQLFVLGPFDGRWIEVGESCNRVSANEYLPAVSTVCFDAAEPQTFKRWTYERQVFGTPTKRYSVFAPVGTSPETIFELLFDRYCPPAASQSEGSL